MISSNSVPLSTVFILLAAVSISACSEKTLPPQTQQPQATSSGVDQIQVESNNQQALQQTEEFKKGLSAMKEGEYSEAERFFREFIRKNPKLAGAYTNLALIYYDRDEFERSLKLVNRAIELNPEQSQALNLRAQLMIEKGEIHKARSDYLRAVELNPGYLNAQYNLALLYDIYLQDIKRAIQHYEIYLSLLNQPDEPTSEWIEQLKRTLKNG